MNQKRQNWTSNRGERKAWEIILQKWTHQEGPNVLRRRKR
jgi:flagellar biosynthesis chaperone FliJ